MTSGLPITLQMALATKARVGERGRNRRDPGYQASLGQRLGRALLGAAAGLSDSPQAASGSGGSRDPQRRSSLPLSVSGEDWTGCTVLQTFHGSLIRASDLPTPSLQMTAVT